MKRRKLLMAVIAAVMAFAMLAGCNGGGGGGETQSYEPVLEAGSDGKIVKDPLTMTIFLPTYNYDKMNIFQEAFKYTNIKFDGVVSDQSTESAQDFQLMLSSGTIADVVVAAKNDINKNAVEGAFIPLDDLIDQYAPNIKAYFEKYPEYKAGCVASDGKLYFIPTTYDALPSEGFYVRQDWLNKLGLEAPTNLDEYYNMLKAFKEQDPNGNGQADEIPYFSRNSTLNGLLQLWGAHDAIYVDEETGKVGFGKAEEEYKNAIRDLAKWYQEGLIDQEIYTRGGKAREQLLGDNLGGATHDWFSSTGSFNKLSDTIPGFEWVAIVPPADVNGVVKETFSRPLLRGSGWGISKDNKYVVETIKYFDWWFTEQGMRTYQYGMEGVDYNMENGVPVPTSVVRDATQGAPMYLREIGQLEQGAPMSMEAEMSVMNEFAKAGFELYQNEVDVKEQFPQVNFTMEEERILKDKGTPVGTAVAEQEQKWIMGIEDIDATWDAYIANLKSMGLDEYIKANQDAYDRYVEALDAAQ